VIGAPSTLPVEKIPGTRNHSFLHKEKVDFLWNEILLFFLEFCGIYLNKFFLEIRMLLMNFFTGKVLGVSITFQVINDLELSIKIRLIFCRMDAQLHGCCTDARSIIDDALKNKLCTITFINENLHRFKRIQRRLIYVYIRKTT
jgi:hypothetical protein